MIWKTIITFAWPGWCGKSPLANYLSINLNLPILNADNIRSEVIEDLWYLYEDKFIEKLKNRFINLLKEGNSFVLDASVDRTWDEVKYLLKSYEYKYYIISFDISKKLLEKLYKNKWYVNFLPDTDRYIREHKEFLTKYNSDVFMKITDDNYLDRFNIVLNFLKTNI